MVSLLCPHCRTSFQAEADLTVGNQVPCPSCRRPVRFMDDSATVMLGGGPQSGEEYVPFSDPGETTRRLDPEPVIEMEAPTAVTAPAPAPSRSSRPVAPLPQPTPAPAPALPTSETVALPKADPWDSRTVAVAPGASPAPAGGRPSGASPVPAAPSRPQPPPPAARSGSGPGGGGGEDLTGRRLGGYLIKRKLGAGGMGAVYLARQLSLDRDVAFKVLPAKLASDPDFVARFTREALSAAHLNHHNVIQVYDVGSEDNVHYISMEFVNGQDLGAMIRRDGKLAVEDAAGYVLQAARGLYYAHNNSIIHRDIKPDNLMVNEHGVVKIADMGLAKKLGSTERSVGLDAGAEDEMRLQLSDSLTGANVAMGTPAYMAPEQGRDASKVDHRADQYSLGCTLYYLCAGKTPFTGKTTFEIISKHASEPLVPLEQHVRNVPKELSYIIEKMLAKNAADRYPSMKEVVEALEAYLGVETSKGPYTPREHHVAVLEREQKDFYAAKNRKLVLGARVAFVVFCMLLLGTTLANQEFFWSAAALGLLVLTPTFSFVLNGIVRKDYVFRRVRSTFFGMSLRRWAQTVGGTLLALTILWLAGLLLPWLAVSLVALGLAAVQQFVIVAKLRKERQPALQNMHDMLKQLRLRGVSEEAIQDFICRFSGEHWEEFFENLFGYEDMVLQRAKWAAREKLKPRKRFATWRDPLVRWAEEVDVARRRAREEKQLAKAEKHRLKATGMDEAAASAEASRLAQDAITQGPMGRTVVVNFDPQTRDQMDKAALDLLKSGRRHGKVFWAFRFARLALGLVLLVGGLAPFLGQHYPPLVVNLFGALRDLTAGVVTSYPALGAAAALLLSVFSGRLVLPVLIFLLGLGMFIPRVVAQNAGLGDAMQAGWLMGLAALVAGIGLVAGKFLKGKF